MNLLAATDAVLQNLLYEKPNYRYIESIEMEEDNNRIIREQ